MAHRIQSGWMIVVIAMAVQGWASPCFTMLSKIVRTRDSRITSRNGKPISDAEIIVKSASRETVFKTESREDGTFHLVATPGKYRVTVNADGYLQLLYVVDLRSGDGTGTTDVSLEGNGECHDVRVISEEEAKQEERCGSEQVSPNLTLKTATMIGGRLRDETNAPFKNLDVRLVSESSNDLQPPQMQTKTDEKGRFTFEEAEPGSYRFIASPHRGFAQPEKLECYEKPRCELDIVVKTSPTDTLYAGCPVK